MKWESPRSRMALSGLVAVGGHLVLCGMFAAVLVDFGVKPPEFVELNVGRFTRQQLTRLMRESERAIVQRSQGERSAVPKRHLPKIDMPAIAPTDEERMLLPDRVSLDDEELRRVPLRPPSAVMHAMPELGSDQKVLYEGTRLNLGPRPGEGVVSEHVGSDIQPVFLIEGQLRGRRFHRAAVTEAPEMPARTRIQLDVIVAPSGAVISAIVARKENAELEAFSTSFIRRCRFDALPSHMPQGNQTGRITITFATRKTQD